MYRGARGAILYHTLKMSFRSIFPPSKFYRDDALRRLNVLEKSIRPECGEPRKSCSMNNSPNDTNRSMCSQPKMRGISNVFDDEFVLPHVRTEVIDALARVRELIAQARDSTLKK